MNKAFKVVWSKARQALMVANEATACVQAKGTKTVVAVAMMTALSGVAMAGQDDPSASQEETPSTPPTLVEPALTYTGVAFTGQSGSVGGALHYSKADTDYRLVDSTFTNNTATSGGGALAITSGASVTIAASGSDLTFTGNKSTADSGAQKDAGFLYLEGAKSSVTFDTAAGRTITIGAQGVTDADGLASKASNNDGTSLTKTGAGTLVINSDMSGWNSDIFVKGGTMDVKTSIGNADYLTTTSNPMTVTVSSGATLTLGDQIINRRYSDGSKIAEGFSLVVEAGANLHAKSITVTQNESKTIEGLGSIEVAVGGNARVDSLSVNAGTFQFWGDGTLNLGSLTVSQGIFQVVDKGTVRIDGTVALGSDAIEPKGATAPAKVKFASGSTVETVGSNLFTQVNKGGDGAQTTWQLTDFGTALKGDVKVVETGYTGTYTLDDLKNANKLFGATNNETDRFSFENATLAKTDGGNYTVSEVISGGGNLGNATIDASGSNGTASISTTQGKDLTLGALKLDSDTTKVTVSGSGALTFKGSTNGGQLIEGQSAAESFTVAGTLNLGSSADDKIVANVAALSAGTLNVAGDVDAQSVTITSGGSVAGSLAFTSLNASGATVAVDSTGTLVLKPAAIRSDSTDLLGTIKVSGAFTTNTAGNAVVAKYAQDDTVGTLYVDRAVSIGAGSSLTIGSVDKKNRSVRDVNSAGTGTGSSNGSVTIGKTAVAVIDGAAFLTDQPTSTDEVDNTVFGKTTDVTNAGTVVLENVGKTGVIELGNTFTNNGTLLVESRFLSAKASGGNVEVSYANVAGTNKQLNAQLRTLFTAGLTAEQARILDTINANDALFSTTGSTSTLNTQGIAAIEEATGGNVTAGTLNVAYDANALIVGALTNHQLDQASTQGVWADAYYGNNRASSLYGSSGYKAELTGGILGYDHALASGMRIGGAITVGSATTHGTQTVYSTTLDSTFYGASLYAYQRLGDVNVKADVGYVGFDNDFTGLGDASDANVVTLGVRADYFVYDGSIMKFTPHLGLRYSYIGSDATAFNDSQKLNVVEMPLGMTVAAQFVTPSFTIRPSLDVTVVPQFGDEGVDTFANTDVRVLTRGLYNATLGVTMDVQNMTFGVNASYGIGSGDRENANFDLRASYRF